MKAFALALLVISSSAAADEVLRREALTLFGRLSAPAAVTPEAELGRALYWDERVSLDGKTSCAELPLRRATGALTGGASRPTPAAR